MANRTSGITPYEFSDTSSGTNSGNPSPLCGWPWWCQSGYKSTGTNTSTRSSAGTSRPAAKNDIGHWRYSNPHRREQRLDDELARFRRVKRVRKTVKVFERNTLCASTSP